MEHFGYDIADSRFNPLSGDLADLDDLIQGPDTLT
jgi:hypothetical protein